MTMQKWHNSKLGTTEYPIVSMVACLGLIYFSPFVSLALNYLAFAVCLYRVVRYDESVFAIDYCVLAGVSYIFLSTGRVSLLAWLSIVAALWYIVKNGVRRNTSFLLLILLLDYMLLRMQMELNSFVLCASQLILLYVLVSTQKKDGIIQSMVAFCISVIVSSIYAMIFRETPKLRSLLGNESAAYWGSSLPRFQGLFRDPNYYMTMIVIAITLITILRMNQHISRKAYLACMGCLLIFGALTYSKTFVVVLVILVIICVAMLFYKGHFLIGIGVMLLSVPLSVALSDTLLSVTIYRITSATNLHDLTTGRSDLLIDYFREITQSASILFFGEGLSAEILERGTHNLFLEVIYYFGLTGLFLMIAYFISLLNMFALKFKSNIQNPNGIFRYAAFVIFVILFCTLQGMTFVITYVMLYLTILATAVTPKVDLLAASSEIEDGIA